MGLAIRPKTLIKFLEDNGWRFVRAREPATTFMGKKA